MLLGLAMKNYSIEFIVPRLHIPHDTMQANCIYQDQCNFYADLANTRLQIKRN